MYGTQGVAGQQLNNNPSIDARPTVRVVTQETIKRLQACIDGLDELLAKVRGAFPAEGQKTPEEMPSVMSDARKLSDLSLGIDGRISELHQVIG